MLILTKIHRAKLVEDMYENEYLYFKSLKDFRSKHIDKPGRLDPRELNLKNVQLTTLTVSTDTTEIHLHEVLKEFSGQYMEHISQSKINVCSLHWLEIEEGYPPSTLNERLFELGNKAMLIYDWKKFFDILDRSIESLDYKFSRKKVNYYNPKLFNGDITLHDKNEEYSWQNEYRILIAPTDNKPIKIPLKGLKQISHIMNTNDLEKLRIKK